MNIGLGNDLAPNSQQIITWTNVDPLSDAYALSGLIEFIFNKLRLKNKMSCHLKCTVSHVIKQSLV